MLDRTVKRYQTITDPDEWPKGACRGPRRGDGPIGVGPISDSAALRAALSLRGRRGSATAAGCATARASRQPPRLHDWSRRHASRRPASPGTTAFVVGQPAHGRSERRHGARSPLPRVAGQCGARLRLTRSVGSRSKRKRRAPASHIAVGSAQLIKRLWPRAVAMTS
jgi:hypothetical protein